jgi:hypothetical protein
LSDFPNYGRYKYLLGDLLTVGLGKGSDGSIVLDKKFFDIKYLLRSDLYFVSVKNSDLIKGNRDQTRNGLYNRLSKRWIVDTSNYHITNILERDNPIYFVLQDIRSLKYGIVDTSGKQIVPISFDSIGCVNAVEGLFWVKKGKKYYIMIITGGKPEKLMTAYDFLTPVVFNMEDYYRKESFYYFIAKYNNKWGVINTKDELIIPFEFDYTTKQFGDAFLLVKNNLATGYDLTSLPNETTEFPHLRPSDFDIKKVINSYELAENSERVFFINDTGKVIIPPQYSPIGYQEPSLNYILVYDDTHIKKIIYVETGQIVDYPFAYDIAQTYPKNRAIAIKDTFEIGYGVVSNKGKELVAPINYGVSIAPNAPIFFVKRDTPIILRDSNFYAYKNQHPFNGDTFNIEDNGWLMYNDEGKVMDKQPFRFPIDFKEGIGVGAREKDFNLFKTDGSILMPFGKNTEGGQIQAFNSIRRDPTTGFYALFRNQGLIPTMILTKYTGEIIVESSRYDGISRFYGQYALASRSGLIGLIDSFGREIIAPKDLKTFEGHFMDSLNIVNQLLKASVTSSYIYDQNRVRLPIETNENLTHLFPDSLNITSKQRAHLWNLMLDKTLAYTITTASDLAINRATKVSAEFIGGVFYSYYSHTPSRISITEKTICFALEQTNYMDITRHSFYNFHQKNNRWEELKINDILQIQGEKRWQFNDLITQKVKALKDVQIDCSNASAFITQVENQFLLTKEGIDFCFETQNFAGDFVVISFTWTELAPYLKMKLN